MNGILGHIVDVLGFVATSLGVSVTIGFGVSKYIDGAYAITGMAWMMNMTVDTLAPGTVGLIAGLIIIMGLSIISAVSGVGRGVIPIKPDPCPVTCSVVHICRVRFIPICNDNICNGIR